MELVEYQVVTVIGCDNQQGFRPIAVSLHPGGNVADCRVTAEYGADGVVEIVVVIGPVNISCLDQQPEPLIILTENVDGC